METHDFFESGDVMFHEGIFPFGKSHVEGENMQKVLVKSSLGLHSGAGYEEDLRSAQTEEQSRSVDRGSKSAL